MLNGQPWVIISSLSQARSQQLPHFTIGIQTHSLNLGKDTETQSELIHSLMLLS
jgi:hypothetical protein